jgi:hypothetical protein
MPTGKAGSRPEGSAGKARHEPDVARGEATEDNNELTEAVAAFLADDDRPPKRARPFTVREDFEE